MKKFFILIITAIALIISGCTENDKSLGVTIQPEEDGIEVASDTFHIECEHFFPVISAHADSMIVGEFYSPKYGPTKAELLLQVAPPIGYVFPEDSLKPTPDSLILMMYYNSWFGSPYSPLEFSIYELNKQPLNYNTQYLSNINPGDYTDSTILMGKRLATSIDVTKNDTVKKDSTILNYIRYKFDDVQLNRFFNMPHDIYSDEESFLNQFKGMYITTRYGSSTLINFNQITLFLYYHYTYKRNGKDTIVNTSIIYPANKEVRQLNRFIHEGIENYASLCNDSIAYIKSAAGIYPKIHIPLGRMKERIKSKIGDKHLNINAAEMIVENIEYDVNDVYMDPPFNLLALTTEEFDDFLKYNTIPTAIDTTALIGSYVASKNGYKFNLNYFITKHLRGENSNPDEDLEMILMPVDVESITSTTGAVTIKRIKPLTKLAATTIRSGKNKYSPLRISLLYNGF